MKKLFDEIPYLEGERVILRRIAEEDRKTLWEMAHSSIIYRYEPTYLLEQQYSDMDQLFRDLYGKYFEKKQNLMVDYLFKETDIEIITASTMVENKASARMLEKNGFLTTNSICREDWGHAEAADVYRWFL